MYQYRLLGHFDEDRPRQRRAARAARRLEHPLTQAADDRLDVTELRRTVADELVELLEHRG